MAFDVSLVYTIINALCIMMEVKHAEKTNHINRYLLDDTGNDFIMEPR